MKKGEVRINNSKYIITLDFIDFQFLLAFFPKKMRGFIMENLTVKKKIAVHKLR